MMSELIDFCKGKKKIFCYGAGEYGRLTYLHLKSRGTQIDGFVVSHLPSNSPKQILGVPIIGLDEFPYEPSECSFLITMRPGYQDQVVSSLLSQGCQDYYKLPIEYVVKMRQSIDIGKLNLDRSGVMVLLYHRVCNLTRDYWKLAISPQLFEQEIAYLKKHYNIIRLGDDWLNIPDKSVIITFDDGYLDNFYYALPILERYSVPATFYICTGKIGTNEEFWWDELENTIHKSRIMGFEWIDKTYYSLEDEMKRSDTCNRLHGDFKKMSSCERGKCLHYLRQKLGIGSQPRKDYRSVTPGELRDMSESSYVNIGGHTVSHGCMAALNSEQFIAEVKESKSELERIIDKEIVDFSYPFGGIMDRTDKTDELLIKEGYKTIATTATGVMKINSADKHMIMRNTISADIGTINEFERFLDLTYAMSDGVMV